MKSLAPLALVASFAICGGAYLARFAANDALAAFLLFIGFALLALLFRQCERITADFENQQAAMRRTLARLNPPGMEPAE